ncbi:hypothetical protein ACIQU4_09585 [Streptomyces sp. NPDC090741]|uniref:hypothetical protein n=1 Tax=Streptomyces sp. NPDC090741 TaxID=3365967 RepID=UPI003808D71F
MSETGNQARQGSGGESRRTGAVVCAFILILGNVGVGYLALLAYAAQPAGPWDSEAVAHSGFAAGLGLVVAVVTALLSWVFVKAEWLSRWWFAAPAVLALAATLRLTLLAPGL